MGGDEVKMIVEVKEDVAEIKAILSTMANTNAIAMEALQSSRSAIEKIDSVIDNQKWLWRTIGGAIIAYVFGVIFHH